MDRLPCCRRQQVEVTVSGDGPERRGLATVVWATLCGGVFVAVVYLMIGFSLLLTFVLRQQGAELIRWGLAACSPFGRDEPFEAVAAPCVLGGPRVLAARVLWFPWSLILCAVHGVLAVLCLPWCACQRQIFAEDINFSAEHVRWALVALRPFSTAADAGAGGGSESMNEPFISAVQMGGGISFA